MENKEFSEIDLEKELFVKGMTVKVKMNGAQGFDGSKYRIINIQEDGTRTIERYN